MTFKQIIKDKSIYICDICGNEMPFDSKDKLSFAINNQWWQIANYTHLDICSKHRKEILEFIEDLKQAEKK